MNKLLFAFATLAAVVTGGPIPQLGGSYSAPGIGGGSSGGGFISGGSRGGGSTSGGFISGGSSGGGFISGGSSGGGFISGGSSGGGFIGGGGHSSGGGFISGGSSGGGSHGGGGAGGSIDFGDGCGGGQIRSAGGSCITPQITRNLFLYKAPTQSVQTLPPRNIPNPKVHLNYVFVRTQNSVGGSNAVVVPPPKQKTLVYVLNKRPDALNQEVIEVPSTPTQPEVFFVNYDQGDDTQLPGGVSLQQALSQSVQQGQTIHGSGGSSLGSIGGGSIGGGHIGGGSIGGGSFIGGGSIGGGSIGGGSFIGGGSSGGYGN